MKIRILGARTLDKFTEVIASGFPPASGSELTLVQIHGSPQSVADDLRLLENLPPGRRVFLIHRPDELLLNAELKSFFEENPTEKIIFLGDLVFREAFWEARRSYCKVIPHPFMDFALPEMDGGRFVLGSFTSWGEMRKLEHVSRLTEELFRSDIRDKFVVKIGGTLDGVPLRQEDLGEGVTLAKDFFAPHFNVQLYHFNGMKRYGESSGSLHRGISVPVIFEANGMERLEGAKVIKVKADEELDKIDFQKAVQDIGFVLQDLQSVLEWNLARAKENTPAHFARAVIDFVS